jgi:hypothetical protein
MNNFCGHKSIFIIGSIVKINHHQSIFIIGSIVEFNRFDRPTSRWVTTEGKIVDLGRR